MKTWTVWLPENTAQEALQEEPRRFSALAKALAQDWSSNSEFPERSLKWISHINSCVVVCLINGVHSFLCNIKDTPRVSSLFAPQGQMRWSGVLSNLLHTLRQKLTIAIDWRPLYELMRHTFTDPLIGMEGALVVATRRRNMFDLCHSAQRFFVPGAAAEIWGELRPIIINVHQMEAFEALGWLSVFMPTQQVKSLDGEWNSWAQDWLQLWESLAHSTMWNNTWMHLFSRLAKHDVGGAVDWANIMPRLFTHILWAFPVPVGTATAQMPFGRHAPDIVQHLMAKEAPSAYKRSAKLAVYLLGQGGADHAGSALSHLQRLVDLLEQYFHPSNGGSWTKSLASFLENFLFHLGKRIVAEQSSALQSEEKSTRRQHLTASDFDAITAMLMKPASKAQYSKDPHLMSCACYAMSQLAYLSPDQVLPLVFERFQAALTAVTATHQLVSAIHTLGLCIRPMLLANRPLRIGAAPDMMDTDTPEVPASEALVNAMNATLPGIDANDEAKTLACFRFYCSALSCMGQLEAEPQHYPLYLSEWVEELMSRIFAILHNLDSPETRTESAAAADAASTHSQSFLLHSESMFRPMAEMLMGRLPPSVAEQTIKQLARFLTTSTMPSVTSEAAVLANSAGWMHPELTAKHIIGPMLTRLESELEGVPSLSSSPAKGLSKTSEARFEWLMGVLDAAIFRATGASLTYQARLLNVLDTCFASSSKVLQQSASHLLMAILEGLLGPYPVGQYSPAHALDRSQGMPNGDAAAPPLEAWCTSSSDDTTNTNLAPQWHTSTPAEVEFAEALLTRYVDDAAAALVSEASRMGDDQAAQKERTRSLLLQIQGGLNGVHSRLPDCAPADEPTTGPKSLRMAGDVLPVGSADSREKIIAALLAAHRHVSDPIILAKLVDALGNVISRGSHEYSEFSANFSAWKNDQRAVQEPAFAAVLTQGVNNGGHGSKTIWKRRRPRWLMVERAYLHLMFRTSQAKFRWWLTVDRPKATLDIIPGPYKAAIADIMKLSMHSHRPVRESALRALDSSFKRYSCLLPACIPTALSALAKLPLPDQPLQGISSSLRPDGSLRLECLPALQQAMVDSAATSSQPEQLSASDAAQEEGMVGGAVSILSCIPPAGKCAALRNCWRGWCQR
ncbi:hypothetical protein WJX84_012367 [Apatococcus fuscideae]|uniref:Proteasome activator Blm10 middle HEAT repeats region domain-containing protein n=1 Tax=Apatococcus fuscideae TaxID=2026836 RepID=A0AAW1RP01_9CHLO